MIGLETFSLNSKVFPSNFFGNIGTSRQDTKWTQYTTTNGVSSISPELYFNPVIENATAFIFNGVFEYYTDTNVTIPIRFDFYNDQNVIFKTITFTGSYNNPRNFPTTIGFNSTETLRRIKMVSTNMRTSIGATDTFSIQTEFFPLLINVRSINAIATVDMDYVDDGVLRLTYEGPDGLETDVKIEESTSVYNIQSLLPETTFVFRIYVDGALIDTISETTLENVSSNYILSDFFDGNKFNLNKFSKEAKENIARNMNNVFNTGDIVQVKDELSVKFVKRGETLQTNGSNVLVPFVQTEGSGQQVNLEVEEGTTVAVGYEETSNSVVIDSTTYSIGDTLVLGSQKCTITDYEDE